MEYSQVLNKIRTYGSQGASLILGMSGAEEYEVSSQGAWIQGNRGKTFLDCGSFALFLFGHKNPLFHSELSNLLSDGLSGTSRILCHKDLGIALECMANLAPEPLRKVMFLNSGAEAVEAAIKLCRLATGRPKIVHLSHSYHGKTAGALSITDCEAFKSSFHPTLQDVIKVDREDIDSLRITLEQRDVAGVFIEPIQGEGGIFQVGNRFLRTAEEYCRKNKTLLIVDEIQCGLGRSGYRWAFEHAGILPDIILSGKALGGGLVPVSALIATKEAFHPYDRNPFIHSSTYAGNPFACRAVIVTHQILNSPDFINTVRAKSLLMTSMLNRIICEYPEVIAQWSGAGLMLGLHFKSATFASYVLEKCLKLGVILSPCLSTPKVLRVTPPYSISNEDIEFLYDCLKRACEFCLDNGVSREKRISNAAS